MSHMISDNEAELHAFAQKLGLKRSWFHRDHYDISQSKKQEALALGAQDVTIRWAVKFMMEKRRGKRNGSQNQN